MTRAWNWKSWRPTTAVCAAYGYVMEISSSSNTFSPLYARFRVLSCLFPLLPSFLPPSLFCRSPLYFLVPLRSLFRLLNVHIPFPSVPDLIAFFPPPQNRSMTFFNQFRPLTDERFPRLPSENLIIMRMDWNVTFPFASTGTSLPPRPSCERNSTAIGLCSRARVEWKICGITLWITMLERVN